MKNKQGERQLKNIIAYYCNKMVLEREIVYITFGITIMIAEPVGMLKYST